MKPKATFKSILLYRNTDKFNKIDRILDNFLVKIKNQVDSNHHLQIMQVMK